MAGKKFVKSTWALSDGSSQLRFFIMNDEHSKIESLENGQNLPIKENDVVSVSHIQMKS